MTFKYQDRRQQYRIHFEVSVEVLVFLEALSSCQLDFCHFVSSLLKSHN